MTDLPGNVTMGCRNCHSINHQTQQCPYMEDENDD